MNLQYITSPRNAKDKCHITSNGQMFLKKNIIDECGIKFGERYLIGRNADNPEDRNLYLVKSKKPSEGLKISKNKGHGIIALAFALKDMGINYPAYAKLTKEKFDGQEVIKITIEEGSK